MATTHLYTLITTINGVEAVRVTVPCSCPIGADHTAKQGT